MTETPASTPAPDSAEVRARPVSARLDENDAPWPLRPWIMAAIGALAGLIFHLLIDRNHAAGAAPGLDALAAFVAIATVVFLLGVEQRRWHWALGFALAWGAVMGLITWTSAGYNLNRSPIEWPFWSGILAVLVATPLFQTRRDVAPDWRFWKLWAMPYERLHSHAWTDAVIGAAGLVFVGITFLLIVLIGQMFKLIGIDLIERLLNGEWFGWMLAGAAFGGAVGLLRERDKLVATLQRLVMIVLAVLAPVLAVALALFLLSLLGTGLTPLWKSGFSTAALMMAAAAFAVLLANAAIGNGRDDRSGNRFLQIAAAALAAAVLPLAAIAYYSMHLRVVQYGWTPERIWGVIAAMIALAYGAAGLWSVVRGRRDFDDLLRPLQQKLAIGLMLLAAFLALPILDFGAISTRDQLGRLKDGTIAAGKFDWAALAFDFGPAGRRALADLAKSPDKAKADLARWALKTRNRWDLNAPGETPDATDVTYAAKKIEEKIRVLPAGRILLPQAYAAVDSRGQCRTAPCVAYVLDEARIVVIGRGNNVALFARDAKTGQWAEDYQAFRSGGVLTIDRVEKGRVEVRPVARRQVFVDGQPLGEVFE
ncbi:hypothetical protein FHR22_000880 [Sphingopyxis panaciterrae]|uniref:DUF4153 domain-containing protein n=1 Tax=Sphingopyxis panaciterrae TaxID=363841 RepID=UPI001FB9E229|nr:DUF4153 domain-containing protein [Sphingopyxis panaciterrae]NIJ36231.1 hypothetical protein [Sphingopyxis panaciterrae]